MHEDLAATGDGARDEGGSVTFSGAVAAELSPATLARLKIDLRRIFHDSEPKRCAEMFVPRLFSGYNADYDVKIVLAVEVTLTGGYERHIVKIGRRDKVDPDYGGWQECTDRRMVASRIFAPVHKVELDPDRVAVVYRDAFSLFGPDEHQSAESAPKLLDEAIAWAVRDNEPNPLSAQRALSHVFTDLGVWFYRGAREDCSAARDFYAKHLHRGRDSDVLAHWQADRGRRELRRHAVWVLCGCDIPDADPETAPARYLDPVDFVGWAMRESTEERLPPTLVGRSHGDLHARNVLVGVRRGEIQYPAVFDYGDMGARNALVWDFAKLETELKTRLLPAIIRDKAVSSWLRDRSALRNHVAAPRDDEIPTANSLRADRLAAFLAFEELLDDVAKVHIIDEHSVDRIAPLQPPPTGLQALDRLVEIILRVRKEAAYWLGFKPGKRQSLWKDELYFALGVYGLLNVRWDYSGPEQESALVSAGLALARMPSVRRLLKEAIQSGPQPERDYPSYRVPLALCYEDWKRKRYDVGCQFVDGLVLKLDWAEPNVLKKIEVEPAMQHAVPLVGQALLLQLERGHLSAVEQVLESMREEARTFRDYETLARVGRVYKNVADRQWEAHLLEPPPADHLFRNRPAWLQMYDKAFDVYAEAYRLTENWYVGINAATLALLIGKQELAESYALQVAKACELKVRHDTKDRYWYLATQGEAAILMNGQPLDYYEPALSLLTPGQSGMADTSYRQAIRLWRALGADGERRVGPVLQLFETSAVQNFLSRGFLGRHRAMQE